MTYAYYHNVIKGSAPKTAPTYVEEEKSLQRGRRYKCMICGYIYDETKEGMAFDELPEDWTCPVCGVRKEQFKLMEE